MEYHLSVLEEDFLQTLIEYDFSSLTGMPCKLANFSNDLEMTEGQISSLVSSLVNKDVISAWENEDSKSHFGTNCGMVKIREEAQEFCSKFIISI